jgi:hypothetical protein
VGYVVVGVGVVVVFVVVVFVVELDAKGKVELDVVWRKAGGFGWYGDDEELERENELGVSCIWRTTNNRL